MDKISRRSFLKKSVVTGAGVAVFPMIFIPKAKAEWAKRTIVHPNINNLRVVGITDKNMTKTAEQIPQTWAGQEKLVNTKVVWESIDKMACGLADTKKIEEAWKSIFIKPPSKSWSDTVVAIKTNCIAMQHTRSAVMSKVCHVLTDVLGVSAGNIHIYDACHGHTMSGTPFEGLPEGTRIEGIWGGSRTTTSVPRPWMSGKADCLGHLVYGTVDILINISMCKGHWKQFGDFTMTMKNHFGTFSPRHAHFGPGATDYLISINKTPEILGKMDPKNGKVLYPRQQLCLVDALWASESGPHGGPEAQPNFLGMGVLSPVVDYILATQFRGKMMNWQPNTEVAQRMLLEFGYSKKDLPSGGMIMGI